MSKLIGKVVVVIGGNSGIGYISVESLKVVGLQVIIIGCLVEKVVEVAEVLQVEGIVVDVSQFSVIDYFVEQVEVGYGKVEILFVNVGIFVFVLIGQISEEMFDYQMGINFKGVVFIIEKFLFLFNDGVFVINLFFVNVYIGMLNMAVYVVLKAVLNVYICMVVIEFVFCQIWVNVVNFGLVVIFIFSKIGMLDEQFNGFVMAM